jgi:hypothetical protein
MNKLAANPNMITRTFGECEHSGDSDEYVRVLESLGATIISVEQDPEEYDDGEMHDPESCTIVFTVTDRATFDKAFKASEIYGF